MPAGEGKSLIRGLGLPATIALVTGNVLGSGIYVMPASLPEAAGPLSLLAWPLVALALLPLVAPEHPLRPALLESLAGVETRTAEYAAAVQHATDAAAIHAARGDRPP